MAPESRCIERDLAPRSTDICHRKPLVWLYVRVLWALTSFVGVDSDECEYFRQYLWRQSGCRGHIVQSALEADNSLYMRSDLIFEDFSSAAESVSSILRRTLDLRGHLLNGITEYHATSRQSNSAVLTASAYSGARYITKRVVGSTR